jgi:hypothetical protein
MGLLSDKETAMGADHVVWGTDAAWRDDRFRRHQVGLRTQGPRSL